MADISKITLPDNSTYNIKDSIARNGVLWYGTCNTLANTIEKAITISGITSLTEGLSIRVKMLNEAAAASPTLNLNSLGAKAITRSAKPSLPSGYSRVLGFSMNDNSYFEIDNFKLTGADTVRFSFSMTANCNVFGCYTNSSATNNYSLFVSTSSTASYLRYNSGTYNSYIPAANRGQQLDVVITPHGVTGMPTNSSWTAKTFTASSDMCIGTSSPDASSASLIGNLYGAFIVDGRFNGIPCERLSDNALGYYDTYSKTFYEPAVGTPASLGYDQNDYFDNAGTGEWAAGEVLDLVYDGTSWIIVDGAIADEETYGYTKLSDSISSTSTNVAATANAVKTAYDLANSKQDALVSGTNIKTINNESLLGSGNIPILAEPEIYICDSTTSYNDVVREYEAGKTLFYHRSISDGDFDDHTYLSLYAVQFNEESEIYLFQFSGIFNNHSYIYEIEGEVQTWSYHVTNLQTSLPSQSSQAGKFLTTNGSSMSWGSISIPAASITTPNMDGSASYGSGTTWARADHVHPSDTSRQAKIIAQGLLEGDGAGNITAASTQSTNSISIDTVVTADSSNLITSGAVAAAIGGAGSTEIYWCTYGTTTSSQIETAYQAGKICAIAVPAGGISVTIDGTPTVVASEGEVYFLTYRKSSTEHRFVCAVPWTSNKILTMTSLWCNNDTWSVDFYDKEVSSIFWCTYGTTTSAQIEAAINEKKLVAVITNVDGQPCTHILTTRSSSTSHTFVCLEEYNQNFYLSYITCSSNSWARDYKNILTSLPSHASASTTYGVGTTAYYGHLKLSDSTSSTNNTSNGTAATPSAVKSAYDRSATLTGRSSSPSTADTNYTTLITRGEKLLDATTYDAVSDWSSQLVNGSIAWRYE